MKWFLFLVLFSFEIAYGAPEFVVPRHVDVVALEAKYLATRSTFDNALVIAKKTYDLKIVVEHAPPELQYSIRRSYPKPRVLDDLTEVCTGLQKNYEWFKSMEGKPLTPDRRRALLEFEDQLNGLTGEEGYGSVLQCVGVSHCYSPKARK